LRHHRLISGATILGVATGMCVVCAILILDQNTSSTDDLHEELTTSITLPAAEPGAAEPAPQPRVVPLPIKSIQIIKNPDEPATTLLTSSIPTQKLSGQVSARESAKPRGEEDYQTMRLAVRMASMFAFFIGSVIVFYTMRFSVAMRIREFSLLLCLGESQRNVALSLVVESLVLGVIGTLAGLLASYPAAKLLLAKGISTTGRSPAVEFSLPYAEMTMMTLLSLVIVLLGVIAPVKSLYRFQISQVLQPRFAADEINSRAFSYSGLSWLIPPLVLASWLAVRPFLESWLSVVYFFIVEGMFVVTLTLLTIWLTRPFLRFGIHLLELSLSRMLPLETVLSVRRIRLNSHKFVFSITGVVLVFSLLGGLNTVTRILKGEIQHWSEEAMSPYLFYHRNPDQFPDDASIGRLEEQGAHIFRLSEKVTGAFPIRLIRADDYNRYREKVGLPLFAPGQVAFSRALAARFGVEEGDTLRIETPDTSYDFSVIEVSDRAGTFPEQSSYIDLKSFALFSDGNPLFRDNLELTLGNFAEARSDGTRKQGEGVEEYYDLKPFYSYSKSGRELRSWQISEIERDFLIFDFILAMTVVLTFIGIVNTLLIQVHSRGRELSVLKTLGVDRNQMFRLLLAEGMVIGLVGGLLAIVLGTALGVVSVSFLDSFTLFEYNFVWSTRETLSILLFAVFTCCVSAIYPAMVATRMSTAESLHYE
jgi:putative ABC transport system permease protein